MMIAVLRVLGPSFVEAVVPLIADLLAVAGFSAALAGFSSAFVGVGPGASGLSSSEKFFFNHLDGKHMAGVEVV